MSAFDHFLLVLKEVFSVVFMGRIDPGRKATAWNSMVAAASEEWVDETVFRFSVTLPPLKSYRELAGCILDAARGHPDLSTLQKQLASRFSISEREALTAIDRTLGGVVRAATLNLRACPDPSIDPVAAAAFDLSTEDPTIIDDIFPGWRSWRPGLHSTTA